MNIYKFILMFLTLLLLPVILMAQLPTAAQAMMGRDGGSVPVGLGATFIDGQTYYLVSFMPEVAFGQLGIGLDINLRFNTEGKLRPGDYSKFEDYLRLIRYVRWAQKGDPFYIRVGQLDYSYLGHGSIIYNYRNSASYDLRRTGIELDFNFEKLGFESVYSDVAGRGLLGLRGYAKPLKFTTLAKIPVVNNFEVGMTYARDLNQYADFSHNGTFTHIDSSRSGLSIYGFDFGLPIISYAAFKTTLYYDFAQIANYGHGSSIGINVSLSGMGILNIRGKYEYRMNGKNYIPAYFNALYEHDRFNYVTRLSKTDTLWQIAANHGYFGELVIAILNTFYIIADYQAPAEMRNQGILHAELQLPQVGGIVIRGAFDKTRIGRIFILDDNSILSAEIGYKPVRYLLVSMLYQRTFSNRNPDGSIRPDGSFIKQDRVEPKVSFIYDF
ncbi:MAG: hypothetical protein EHM64_10590 [Ignavibacteriae bacterium]|nr:MAG: hypothetical protein EHM64_10590 [Ignavibacteriota bacterium]